MASIQLYNLSRTKIDVIELDAVVRETTTDTYEITEHPVESGTNITDHVRRVPQQLSIEGVVTNTPINFEAQRRTTSFLGETLQTFATDGKPRYAFGNAQLTLQALDALARGRSPFTVTTAQRIYDNMVIQSLTIPRDSATGEALRFVIGMREVIFVETQLTTATAVADNKGKAKLNKGKQPTAPTKTAEVRKSWLLSLIGTENADKLGTALGITP